jgi:hypothetical protein
LVGAASGPNEFYNGDIAEIRLFNTVLTEAERATVEAELQAAYGAPIPEPSTLALAALGTLGLVGYAWRRWRGP